MKTKNTGLGKGLGALISSIEEETQESEFQLLPLSQIQPSSYQPRRDFDETSLAELTESIKQNGVLQPILVMEVGANQFQIIAGERRWRAAIKAELTHIPCRILKNLPEKEIGTISLIENLQREDLNPIEFAEGCKKLIEENNWTHEELSSRIGKARVTITNTLRLLQLPIEIQESIRRGEITEGHGRALLQCKENKMQLLWRQTIENKLSVRQLEELVQTHSKTKKVAQKKGKEKFDDPVIRNRLEDLFGCKISFDGNTNKGKISFCYFSESERERIIEKLINL